MTKPKWILENEFILATLRLDRFPVECKITAEPKKSSWGWRHSIHILITVKSSIDGNEILLGQSFDLHKNSNLKEEILRELLRLMDHEVRETIQFELEDGTREIPFNPHQIQYVQLS